MHGSGVSQDPFGFLRVTVQLLHEGLGALEFLNLPNARLEPDFECCSIEFGSLVIEKVDFHSGGTVCILEGGARAYVDHGRPALRTPGFCRRVIVGQGMNPGGIYPFSRQQLVRFFCSKVGSRISQLLASAVSMDHRSAPRWGMTEQTPGFRNGAVSDPLADFGAGHGDFALDMGRDVLDDEAIRFAAGLEKFHVSFPSCSETVVVSYNDGRGAQSFNEHIPNEFLGPEPGEGAVERLNDQMIQSGFRQFLDPLIEGLDQLQATVFPEQHLAGVGVKSEHDRLSIAFCGFFHHPVQQGTVSEMDSVKCAGGDNALSALWEVGKSSVCQHWSKFKGVRSPGRFEDLNRRITGR